MTTDMISIKLAYLTTVISWKSKQDKITYSDIKVSQDDATMYEIMISVEG